MAQQTAVEWLIEKIAEDYPEIPRAYREEYQKAKAMEKEQMKDAVLYGLDEDGHTGDWKISVAENYYIKTYTK